MSLRRSAFVFSDWSNRIHSNGCKYPLPTFPKNFKRQNYSGDCFVGLRPPRKDWLYGTAIASSGFALLAMTKNHNVDCHARTNRSLAMTDVVPRRLPPTTPSARGFGLFQSLAMTGCMVRRLPRNSASFLAVMKRGATPAAARTPLSLTIEAPQNGRKGNNDRHS